MSRVRKEMQELGGPESTCTWNQELKGREQAGSSSSCDCPSSQGTKCIASQSLRVTPSPTTDPVHTLPPTLVIRPSTLVPSTF